MRQRWSERVTWIKIWKTATSNKGLPSQTICFDINCIQTGITEDVSLLFIYKHKFSWMISDSAWAYKMSTHLVSFWFWVFSKTPPSDSTVGRNIIKQEAPPNASVLAHRAISSSPQSYLPLPLVRSSVSSIHLLIYSLIGLISYLLLCKKLPPKT